MRTLVINQGSRRAPRAFVTTWAQALARALARRGHPGLAKRELVVVFVDAAQMRRLNREYRGKDYATDVLSFEGAEPESLGELVMCLDVLRAQARDTGLTFRRELGYMLTHGVLHLLGYDHEVDEADAARMFKLQDEIFAKI